MKNYVICLAILVIALGPFTMAEGLPAFVKVQKNLRGENNGVLYAGEGFSLVIDMNSVQRASAAALNRDNLFAARFIHSDEILPKLGKYATVLYVGDDKKEAILSIDNPLKLDELAALLHEEGGTIGCGSIIKLMKPQEVLDNARKPVVRNAAVDALIEKATNAKKADPKIQEMTDLVDPNNIRDFVQELAAYQNRYHRSTHGAAASNFIFQTYSSYKQSNPNLTVKQVTHSGTPQRSIVAILPGTTLPNEKVIMGSHIDSISSGGTTSIAPGADDNASGTATVKEVLRIIATHGYTFKRTIEFHGYAAEEIGLVGSAEIASSYKNQGIQVVGMIQIDMNLYVSFGTPKIWLVTNDTNSQHTNLAANLIDQYCSIGWSKGMLFGGTSDHRSWSRRGYPAIFPFENPSNYNGSIHTSQDTFAKSGNLTLAGNMAKLALAYLSSVAEVE